METQLLKQIVEKLKTLSEPALREILTHVDQLDVNETGSDIPGVVSEPWLSIAGTLSGLPLESQEIDTALADA
jgi:hypothetical protein